MRKNRLRLTENIQQIFEKLRPMEVKGEKSMGRRRIVVWIAIAAGTAAAALLYFGVRHWRPRWSVIQGTVIRRDSDVRRESPIAGVLILASHGGQASPRNPMLLVTSGLHFLRPYCRDKR